MSRLLFALAAQTWTLAQRDRLHYALPAYALATATLVPLASHLSLGSSSRAAWEAGLGLQWLVVCAAGAWLGLTQVGRDLDRRTVAVVLSAPVQTHTWLAGRALGSTVVLAALVLGLQAIWLVACGWLRLELDPALIAVTLALWLEGALVGALAALLSTWARPLVAGGATVGIWVAGHLSSEYSRLTSEWGAGGVATVVFSVIPDLDLLDLHGPLVSGAPLPASQAAGALLYGSFWLVALCALTVASLRSRDLA